MASIFSRHVLRAITKGPSRLSRQISGSGTSFNKNILKSDYEDIYIPDVTVHEYIFDKIASHGSKIACECNTTGRKYTYDEVIKKSKNFGRALRQKLKLQRNDVVAVLLPNVPEYQIAVFGIMSSGNRVTTINPAYTSGEIRKQLVDSDAKAVITLTDFHSVVKDSIDKMSMPIITINHKADNTTPQGAINFDEFANSNISIDDINDIDPRECVFMPYSSGTTGLPKGVRLSHRNLVDNVCQINSEDFTLFEETGTNTDIIPAVLPFFHIYGFTCINTASMVAGSKIITMTHFEPNSFIKMLEEKKPTILMCVPPIIIFLYAHPQVTAKHLDSIRVVVSGAAPLGALDAEKLLAKAGRSTIKVQQGYGMTETSPVIIMHPRGRNTPLASAGKLIPNTFAKILPVDDVNGEPLGPNQKGELYVKGEQAMLGYHNRPKETAETVDKDGWLRTGDMFYYDENRNFYVTDRIKELIKVKGFQVPPAELEEIIRDYPDVSDAAVIGISHEISGEVPRAYVVPKPNSKLDTEKLHEFINKQVAEYKQVVGGIEIVQSIPKNPSGKILRRALKAQYEEELKK